MRIHEKMKVRNASMKRIFVLFLSLLLVCCFAVAEETYTMRNGIQFGDTKEVLLEKLGDEGSFLQEDVDDEHGAYLYTPRKNELTIAGVSGVLPYYYFNNNGQLNRVRYYACEFYEGDMANINKSLVAFGNYYDWLASIPKGLTDGTEYYKLKEKLTQKYGIPTESEEDSTLYSEWLIPQPDGSAVKICSLYEQTFISSEKPPFSYKLEWDYCYIEPEVIQKAIDETVKIFDDL